MYTVDDQDKVIELKDLPPSAGGAPLPLVIATDDYLAIAYVVAESPADWDGTNPRSVSRVDDELPIATVRYDRPLAHLFGPPNDEAWSGHPLAGRGYKPYGAFEVLKSSWIRRLEEMNRVHPHHNPAWFLDGLRHFIFGFHDTNFECIATGLAWRIERGSIDSVSLVLRREAVSG